MKGETARQAAERWAGRDFDNIPGELVKRAFKDEPESLELLAGGERRSNCCDAEVQDRRDTETGEGDECVCTDCEQAIDPDYDVHWSGAELDWPAAWGTMFHPSNRSDEAFIRDNADAVAGCGFIVYDSDETGILLGVDGAGYSFYDDHWLPLYLLRGLKWHETEGEP